jgi:hypothetical protein
MTKSLVDKLDTLSEEQLLELFEADLAIEHAKQQEDYSRLLEQAILIVGKKGRGKTLSAVDICYNLREDFDRPVICIGSKMGLNPETFGAFQNMDERAFRDEMERLNIAASEEENAEQVANAFKKYGVSVLYATLVFDEARKPLNSRRPGDKLVQLTGDFVMQSRHYHSTIVLLAPNEDEIDKRVVRQIDWKGRCFHNKYTDICRLRLVQGLEVINFDIDAVDESQHPRYYDMYNSWVMVGYRQTSLQINKDRM